MPRPPNFSLKTGAKSLALAIATLAGFVLLSLEAEAEPERVVLGVYVNDIQAIDLRTHSYVVDLYVWFRWRGAELDPGHTFEFMNTFDPEGHVGKLFYEEPLDHPDGSSYTLVRHQGAFSSKFDVTKYPFDTQQLKVIVEDEEMGADELVYVPDETPVVINPDIVLPGYRMRRVDLRIENRPYPTAFGFLEGAEIPAYSRATVVLTVSRPILSSAVKSFLPIVLIVMGAVFALLLDPAHVEARVGLAITSLLALVALQLSSGSGLPEVGYLLMLDEMYLASYFYVLTVILLVVGAARLDEQGALQGGAGSLARLAARGPYVAATVTVLYAASLLTILMLNLL